MLVSKVLNICCVVYKKLCSNSVHCRICKRLTINKNVIRNPLELIFQYKGFFYENNIY